MSPGLQVVVVLSLIVAVILLGFAIANIISHRREQDEKMRAARRRREQMAEKERLDSEKEKLSSIAADTAQAKESIQPAEEAEDESEFSLAEEAPQEEQEKDDEEIPEEPDPNDELIKKILAGEVIPKGTVINHDLDFTGVDGIKDIILNEVIIEGGVDLEDVVVSGMVSFKGAIVKGNFDINNASAKRFDLHGITVTGDVYPACDAPQGLFLSGAIIRGDVQSEESIFKGDVVCDGIRLDGGFNSLNSTFPGKLSFSHAQVKAGIDLDGCEINFLSAKLAEIEGTFYLQNATVKDNADFSRATFHEAFYVSGTSFEGDADFSGANIKDDFNTEDNGISIEKKLDFSKARIGRLDLGGAAIGSLDICGARIRGDCNMNSAEVKGIFLYAEAVIDGDLDLDESEVPILPGLTVKGETNI